MSTDYDYWRQADWTTIGFHLDSRAKRYSLSDTRQQQRVREGFLLYHHFRQLLDEENPIAGRWDWIFYPLLAKLLDKHANWVCLGHFAGLREHPDREWLYFFGSEQSYDPLALSPLGNNLTSFAGAARALSFNANMKEASRSALLLTAELVDLLFSKSSNSLTPTKILEFQGQPVEPIRDIKLANAFSFQHLQPIFDLVCAGQVSNSVSLAQICPDTTVEQWVLAHLPRGEKPLPIPFLWNIPKEDELLAGSKYAQRLKEVSKTISAAIPTSVQALTDLNDEQKQRIVGYVAWMHDVCAHSAGIVTIHAWLPGRDAQARWGAMIVSLKEGQQLTDLVGLANAFRLGCVNIVRAEGAKEGVAEIVHTFAHQTKRLAYKATHNWVPRASDLFDITTAPVNTLPGGKLGRLIIRDDYPTTELGIAPLSSLVRDAGRVLNTWCMESLMEDNPFPEDKTPSTIIDFVKECWCCAVDTVFLHSFSTFTPRAYEEIDRAIKCRELFRKVFTLAPDLSCETFPTVGWTAGCESTVWFARFLIALLENVVQHGDPFQKASISITRVKESSYKLICKNPKMPPEGQYLTMLRTRFDLDSCVALDFYRRLCKANKDDFDRTKVRIGTHAVIVRCLDNLEGTVLGWPKQNDSNQQDWEGAFAFAFKTSS